MELSFHQMVVRITPNNKLREVRLHLRLEQESNFTYKSGHFIDDIDKGLWMVAYK